MGKGYKLKLQDAAGRGQVLHFLTLVPLFIQWRRCYLSADKIKWQSGRILRTVSQVDILFNQCYYYSQIQSSLSSSPKCWKPSFKVNVNFINECLLVIIPLNHNFGPLQSFSILVTQILSYLSLFHYLSFCLLFHKLIS